MLPARAHAAWLAAPTATLSKPEARRGDRSDYTRAIMSLLAAQGDGAARGQLLLLLLRGVCLGGFSWRA
jgi:hypothetical protein